VPRTDRVPELEFCLPARGVDLAAVHRLMRDAGLPGLPGHPARAAVLRGHLRGFIDLVVRHGTRWHVVDWKSNHLGERAAGYRGEALAQAMAEHDYTLQALLYALALHRWLRVRLRSYDPARHLGGVHYLFVRGVRRAWPDAGVHSWTPEPALLDRLSALFDGAAPR
jgi:exodeoxyribonuclease V beta subunit